MCKFSILTACYNKEHFIHDCVRSVIGQRYEDWEYIIVDDCSTDKSYDYLSSLGDKRITVVRNEERMYCSSTYARALELATGDVCGILDGDDVLHKRAMSTVARCYSEHPKLSYLYTQFFWCNRDMKKCHGGVSSLPTDGKSLVDTVLTTGRHCFSHWRTFKRKLASKATLFPEGLKVSVDKNLGFQLEELGRGGFLPRALYYYRYYPGNMSRCHGRDQKRTTTCLAFQYRDRRKKEGIIPYPIRKMK